MKILSKIMNRVKRFFNGSRIVIPQKKTKQHDIQYEYKQIKPNIPSEVKYDKVTKRKEYVLNIMSKRTIIMGMILFILGFSLFWVEQDMIMKYTMLACAFLGIISIFITPLTMINSFEKAAKRLNNGSIEKTKIVFNENIITKKMMSCGTI